MKSSIHKYPIKRKVTFGGRSTQQILITEQTSKENLVELGMRLRKLLECSKKTNKSRQEVKRFARLVEQERRIFGGPAISSVLDDRWSAKRDSIVLVTESHSRRPSSTSASFHMKRQQHRGQIMDDSSTTTCPQSWKGNKSSTARKVSISPGPLESSLPRLQTQLGNGRLSPLPSTKNNSIFTEGNGSFFSPNMDHEVQKFQSQFFPSW